MCLLFFLAAKQPCLVIVESIVKVAPRAHKATAGNILLKDLKVGVTVIIFYHI